MQPIEDVEEHYQQYARTVYKYLLSLTRDEDLAEELTQETFYQAIRCSDKFNGSCAVSTWLCGIAKNALRTYRRKHPPHEELADVPEQNLSLPSAESDVMGSAERVALFRRLHELPEPYREILYLRIFGGLSFKEIGEVQGKTENWARVTFYRGREKLRKDLDTDE